MTGPQAPGSRRWASPRTVGAPRPPASPNSALTAGPAARYSRINRRASRRSGLSPRRDREFALSSRGEETGTVARSGGPHAGLTQFVGDGGARAQKGLTRTSTPVTIVPWKPKGPQGVRMRSLGCLRLACSQRWEGTGPIQLHCRRAHLSHLLSRYLTRPIGPERRCRFADPLPLLLLAPDVMVRPLLVA